MTKTKTMLAALALLISFAAGCAVATPPKGTTPKMMEPGK